MIGSFIGYYTGFLYDIQDFDINFAEPKDDSSKKSLRKQKIKILNNSVSELHRISDIFLSTAF
jgi:hypothetical protein